MKLIPILFLLLLFACSDQPQVKVAEPDTTFLQAEQLFSALAANDVKLSPPKWGDWLYEHKEAGQTFEDFTKLRLVEASDNQNTIYIQPFGKFTKEQEGDIHKTAHYVGMFFHLPTKVLPVKPDNAVPDSARRQHDGSEQLLSGYFLKQMKNQIPANGIAFMTITAKDLYPKDDWNFVFGQASYSDRTGVTSIYRYQNDSPDSSNSNSFLSRLINVTSHELGHMFLLRHCTFAHCAMNGSNNLRETDESPNRLCSNCLKKMHWNFRFDNRQRIESLKDFFYKNKLWRDYELMKADLDKVKTMQ